MTKSQFYDVLMNPDSYTGVKIIMYCGFPQQFNAQIFYCTPDRIYYTYEDWRGLDAYGTITKDNYILAQFRHCVKSEKVL